MLVSLLVLLLFQLAITGTLPPTIMLVPLVWAPFLLLLLGLSWALASLGVFLRDISQPIGVLVTAFLFLSPILYPSSALPEGFRGIIYLNPLTFIIEQTRAVLLWGQWPAWGGLVLYSVLGSAIAWLGWVWFQKTRKGFADVL
jgi:lipopolysaccharide transport system permease protein